MDARLLAVGAVAGGLHLWASGAERRRLSLALKPLPVLALAAWVSANAQGAAAWLVVAGLCLSLVADVLIESSFLAGLATFLAAHVAYTAAFLDYYHRELDVPGDRRYVVTAPAYKSWDWKHRVLHGVQPMVNTGVDLAHAIGYNPDLRVLVLNGVYDLATPFLATEYMMDHLGLAPALRQHVTMKYYDAGHMMYLHEPSLVRMKADVAAFIDRTDRLGAGG